MAGEIADLLVVGGGPAGLATAVAARLAGLDTIVIDPLTPPIERACGEGLMPDGVELLRQLGVVLPANRRSVLRGIRFVDGETAAEAAFTGGHGIGVRRVDLHRELGRRAEDVGVRLRWGVRATGLDGGVVTTDRGVVRGRWLVAADGRASRMRRWAGLEGAVDTHRRFGIRRHYRLPPWTDLVEVHWADQAEAYVTPVGDSTVGVAVLTGGPKAGFDALLDEFPALRGRIGESPQVTRDRGAGGFGHRPKAVVLRNLALVGDASGSLDPITGEGLAVAFHQALAVVESILRGSLDHYAREHRRIMRVARLFNRVLLGMACRPRLRARLIRLLAARPALFDHLLSMRTRGSVSTGDVVGLAGSLVGIGAGLR